MADHVVPSLAEDGLADGVRWPRRWGEIRTLNGNSVLAKLIVGTDNVPQKKTRGPVQRVHFSLANSSMLTGFLDDKCVR